MDVIVGVGVGGTFGVPVAVRVVVAVGYRDGAGIDVGVGVIVTDGVEVPRAYISSMLIVAGNE